MAVVVKEDEEDDPPEEERELEGEGDSQGAC